MSILEIVKDIDKAAMELRAKIDNKELSFNDAPIRERARVLKRNNVYSEADLERFNEDQRQAAAINRENRSVY